MAVLPKDAYSYKKEEKLENVQWVNKFSTYHHFNIIPTFI